MKGILIAILFFTAQVKAAKCIPVTLLSSPPQSGCIPVKTKIEQCLDDVLSTYSDTCGEMDTDGPDAHFDGFKCAIEAAKGQCL